MIEVTTPGQLSWNVARVGRSGEDVVGGELAVEGHELWFRPKKNSEPAVWRFHSALAGITDVTTVEPTLEKQPWSLQPGIRIRTTTGSQATFYLMGRAKDRADVVVAGLSELVKSSSGPSEFTTPTKFADPAENAPTDGSTSAMRKFRSYSWVIGVLGLVFYTPELITRLGEADSSIDRLWVFIYPGMFLATCLHFAVGRFVNVNLRNHPLLAVLPITLYLVGVSILALAIYAFYAIPTSAALAPLLVGVPAAILMAMALSPDRRRAWREARDNDARAARSA